MSVVVVDVKLDKAAFLILKGGVLLEITGEFKRELFKIETTQEVLDAHSRNKLVDYEKFMAMRYKLKVKTWRQNGTFH